MPTHLPPTVYLQDVGHYYKILILLLTLFGFLIKNISPLVFLEQQKDNWDNIDTFET